MAAYLPTPRSSLTLKVLLTTALATTLGCSDGDSTLNGGAGECPMNVEVDQSTCAALCGVVNGAYCGDNGVTPNCEDLSPSEIIDVCGVTLKQPPAEGEGYVELKRSENVNEYAGSGPPDVSCYNPSGYPDAPGTSETVTMKGFADLFSHGCVSEELDITVYKVKRGGADDGMPGEMVGSTVTTTTLTECMEGGTAKTEEDDDCDTGFRYACAYEYPGVPTATELMVITKGSLWTPINEYNLYIENSAVQNGEYDKDVRALASDDYNVIAQTVMGKNITPGHGALAGEVHDCGDVRLINAVVDIDVPKYVTT
ncbi:MAG: hypothetical protein JRI68_13010, partial [Deltaproteobacteria bacterium]|nr:hypothetical protein [Deltaproteobacteria bacterium]